MSSPAHVFRVGDRVDYHPSAGVSRAGVVVAIYPATRFMPEDNPLIVWECDDGTGHDGAFAADLVPA